jgi:hypothetical protein
MWASEMTRIGFEVCACGWGEKPIMLGHLPAEQCSKVVILVDQQCILRLLFLVMP